MYNANVCYGANNYNDILYFLSNTTIHPHIDRIYFSCRSDIDSPEKTLFSVIEENVHTLNLHKHDDMWIKRSKYKRIKLYYCNETDVKISILYERKKHYSYCPCMVINIYKPDIKTIDWFDAICNSLGILTTLSHVELTIDFSPYEYGLQEFLQNHLFLKYNSGNIRFVGDDVFKSFYIGYRAKNSKSVIVYDKNVNDLNVLRLEFRLNRSFLKRHELELDCFDNINNIDLSSLISFKRINRGKLSKHLQWRHKEQILRLGKGWRGVYVRQLMSYLGYERSVANQIACMKGSPYKNNCQRFLEDMPEANEALFGRLKNLKFI